MAYAASTDVSVEKTRAEIEKVLARGGAQRFGYMIDDGCAVIAFQMKDRHVRFELPLPTRADKQFTEYKRGSNSHARSESAALAAWEQACRSRWRALLLAIRAKLESVEIGICTFEDEFLAYIVMPDNKTVGDHVRASLPQIYGGQNVPLLPARWQ